MAYEVARFDGGGVMAFRAKVLHYKDEKWAEIECVNGVSRSKVTLSEEEIQGLLDYLNNKNVSSPAPSG